MRHSNWLQALPDLSDELLSRFLPGGLGPRDPDRDDDDNDDDERDAGDAAGDDVDHQVVLKNLRSVRKYLCFSFGSALIWLSWIQIRIKNTESAIKNLQKLTFLP